MKLKPFLITGLLAAGATYLYKNQDKITRQLNETSTRIKESQTSLSTIKNSLTTLTEQKANLEAINQDLTYQFRVFNQEIQAHLAQIKSVTDKYQSKGDS